MLKNAPCAPPERHSFESAARSAPAVRSEPASGGQGASEERVPTNRSAGQSEAAGVGPRGTIAL